MTLFSRTMECRSTQPRVGEPWMFYPQTISSQVVSLDPQEFPPWSERYTSTSRFAPWCFFSSQAQTSMLSYRG